MAVGSYIHTHTTQSITSISVLWGSGCPQGMMGRLSVKPPSIHIWERTQTQHCITVSPNHRERTQTLPTNHSTAHTHEEKITLYAFLSCCVGHSHSSFYYDKPLALTLIGFVCFIWLSEKHQFVQFSWNNTFLWAHDILALMCYQTIICAIAKNTVKKKKINVCVSC